MLQWGERGIATVALLSTSGANKSAILTEMQSTVEDAAEFHAMPSFTTTDFTVESLMAQMQDTDGAVLLVLDEMKKIKAVDEYKKGKEGAGKQRLMELQSGVKFRVVRKGGPKAAREPASSFEADEARPKQSVSIIEARSHLNIIGTTHIHTGIDWFKEHQGQTDGEMTRYDCVVVDAEYNDLPDREIMEALGTSYAEGIDLFLLFTVIKVMRDTFIEKLNGNIFLDDDAYADLQLRIKDDINPKLRCYAGTSEAGSQVSSWSKTKGKCIKYAGGAFMMLEGEKICAHEEVMNYDFENGDAEDFVAIVKPIVVRHFHLEEPGEGSEISNKLIGKDCMEYGWNWAKMFNDTGLALQQCMVHHYVLPSAPVMSHSSAVDDADTDAVLTSEKHPTSAARRPSHTAFASPIDWGMHSVIVSPKFEVGYVSASYMTVVRTQPRIALLAPSESRLNPHPLACRIRRACSRVQRKNSS